MDSRSVDSMLKTCQRLISSVAESAELYRFIFKAQQVRRSPPIWGKNEGNYDAKGIAEGYEQLKQILNNGIRLSFSVHEILLKFGKSLTNANCLSANATSCFLDMSDIVSFDSFWVEVSSVMEATRQQLAQKISEICLLELDKSHFYMRYVNYLIHYGEKTEQSSYDARHYVQVEDLLNVWKPWIRVVPLVMEFEPSSLPFDAFLDVTDAIYIFYWNVFMRFNLHYNRDKESAFYNMSKLVYQREFPGSLYLIDTKSTQNTTSLLKDSYPYKLADRLKTNFVQHFPNSLLRRIITNSLRKMVREVGDLYVEMRRSLTEFCRFYFHENEWKNRLSVFLQTGLRLRFFKCLEFLRRFRLLGQKTSGKTNQIISYEGFVSVRLADLYQEVNDMPKKMLEELNELFINLMRDYHLTARTKVLTDMIAFGLKAASIMEKKGILFNSLPTTIRLDITNLVVAQKELEKIVDRVLRGLDHQLLTNVDWLKTAPQEFRDLQLCILKKLRELKKQMVGSNWRGYNVNFIFQGIPMTQSVRSLAAEVVNITCKNGKIAPPRLVQPTFHIKTKYATLDPTNPAEDQFMNEAEFRKILELPYNQPIAVHEDGVKFEKRVRFYIPDKETALPPDDYYELENHPLLEERQSEESVPDFEESVPGTVEENEQGEAEEGVEDEEEFDPQRWSKLLEWDAKNVKEWKEKMLERDARQFEFWTISKQERQEREDAKNRQEEWNKKRKRPSTYEKLEENYNWD